MAKVTFLGGDEAILGNVGFIKWPYGPPGNQTELILPLNKAVEVKNPHILSKLRGMAHTGYFEIEEDKPEEKQIEKSAHGTGAKDEHGASDEEESDEKGGTLKGSRARKIT